MHKACSEIVSEHIAHTDLCLTTKPHSLTEITVSVFLKLSKHLQEQTQAQVFIERIGNKRPSMHKPVLASMVYMCILERKKTIILI